MRKTKLAELLEHFSLNFLTQQQRSNRWTPNVCQINSWFYLKHVFFKNISVPEIKYQTLIIDQSTVSYKTNKHLFESAGYHNQKSALNCC